jgi:hypothetical protein
VFHGPRREFCRTGNSLSSASHVLSFIHSRPHLSASDSSIVYSIRGLKVEAGPRFLSLNSLASFSTLFRHTTKNCLTLPTMSSVPTSFHGIHPDDDHDPHQDSITPIDASSNMGSGEPFYPTHFDRVPIPSFPNPNNISATQSLREELPAFLMNGVTEDAGLAPVLRTYNAFPHFQAPFPFVIPPGVFFSGFSGLPTSPESTLVPLPPPGPSRINVAKRKRIRKSKDKYTKRTGADPTKGKRVAHTRRTRGPTRKTTSKPRCAGFEFMFVRSSHLVLDNYKRHLTKRNSHIHRISSRSKSNVLSTRFILDVARP